MIRYRMLRSVAAIAVALWTLASPVYAQQGPVGVFIAHVGSVSPEIGNDYLTLWNGSAKSLMRIARIRVTPATSGLGPSIPTFVEISRVTTPGSGCTSIPVTRTWSGVGAAVTPVGLAAFSSCAVDPVSDAAFYTCASDGSACFDLITENGACYIIQPGSSVMIRGVGALPTWPAAFTIASVFLGLED